jgi:hypothetical protein
MQSIDASDRRQQQSVWALWQHIEMCEVVDAGPRCTRSFDAGHDRKRA